MFEVVVHVPCPLHTAAQAALLLVALHAGTDTVPTPQGKWQVFSLDPQLPGTYQFEVPVSQSRQHTGRHRCPPHGFCVGLGVGLFVGAGVFAHVEPIQGGVQLQVLLLFFTGLHVP